MRFALTEDQIALRDAVRAVLAGPAADSHWPALADLGVLGAAAPAEHGGLGLGDADFVPLLEEIGAAVLPVPVAATAAVAVPLLAAAGDPGGLLPAIIGGRLRVDVAGPDGLALFGQRADLVLHPDGRLAPPRGATPVSTVDTSLAAAVVPAPAGPPLTGDPGLLAAFGARVRLAAAAELIGLGRRMLDLTVAYVKQRHQFGVPVGSFQAVKHHLADATLDLEFAAPAVLAAGWALGHADAPGVDPERDVAAAVVLAAEAAHTVSRVAIQCHGAIGYTVEYELHRYAKRAWALAARCDVGAQLDRLAESLDLPPDLPPDLSPDVPLDLPLDRKEAAG